MSEEPQHSIHGAPVELEGDLGSTEKARATVLQVLPALGAGGGVERGTVEIARAISEAGGRSLVASAGGAMVHEIARAKAEHFTLPVDRKNPFVMRSNVGRLEKLILDEDVDIVHVRSRAPAWSAWAAARRANKPLVTTFHGTYSAGNPLKRKYNSVMTFGARVIAISNFIAGHVRQVYGVAASKIRVIPRGVDLDRFDPSLVSAERVALLANQWRLGDGNPVIMLPGRLTRWKGQTVFLEAISRLGRNDIRCVLVGSDQGRKDYRRELDDLIARHDLGGVVRIVDHCNDMPAAYMLTDLVVSASTDPEAFGRVVPEAQALGRPVIASDHGGAKETVVPGETGWLTPPGDASALADAIGRVLALDEPARHRLAERAVDNVRRNFSKDTMCARTLDVYNEVLHLKEPA
ncbi:MAG: glycosyltransferase family 4 protein [Rhodospirillales bacterium]|nr:glycosyltransferase family 4 protein [Rhodospirillales bacterium]